MSQTETQPIAVIDTSLEKEELLSVIRELKRTLKEAIAALARAPH